MTLVRDMPEHKRLKIKNALKNIDERDRNNLKKKEIKRIRDIKERQKIEVYNLHDFQKKYEFYNVTVNIVHKIATLREPIEVSYFPIFKQDCAILGLKWEIKVNRPDTSYLRY